MRPVCNGMHFDSSNIPGTTRSCEVRPWIEPCSHHPRDGLGNRRRSGDFGGAVRHGRARRAYLVLPHGDAATGARAADDGRARVHDRDAFPPRSRGVVPRGREGAWSRCEGARVRGAGHRRREDAHAARSGRRGARPWRRHRCVCAPRDFARYRAQPARDARCDAVGRRSHRSGARLLRRPRRDGGGQALREPRGGDDRRRERAHRRARGRERGVPRGRDRIRCGRARVGGGEFPAARRRPRRHRADGEP